MMEQKYRLTLYVNKFMKVGEDYQTVEMKDEFDFDWETLVAFLGCIADNSITSNHKFEIKKIKEENNEEAR